MYKSRVVGLEDSLKERTKTAVAHVPPEDWFKMSEVEKWQHSIDVWEREKWKMLRKYLTPEQLEAVSNVNGIVKRMRYGLKRELEDNSVAEGWPVIADWEDYNAD